jgi:DNA-binding response OmpR family regulator
VPLENTRKHKVLLLDDDPEVLDLYQQMILQMPSQPEVHIATSGQRALDLLDTEPFALLVSDLKMPKMDGLQVLTLVRRKFPDLRTIVLTGVADEEMRTRAYSMGIDLYLEKPNNAKELNFLMECIQSLLEKEKLGGGFRGVQSKSLVDLIQLECLSGSTSVLKITNNKVEGRVWIVHGELFDAATPEENGETAFKRILSWKTGTFEILPGEADHPRKILTSYQGLLLDSVQEHDEVNAELTLETAGGGPVPAGETETQILRRDPLARIQGLEYALKVPRSGGAVQKWGVENPDALATWLRKLAKELEALGDKYKFGDLKEIEGKGSRRQLSVTLREANLLALGLLPSLDREQVEQSVQKVMEQWGS